MMSRLAQDAYGADLQGAVSLLLEVVFAENSRPLHRTVLAAFKRLVSPQQQGGSWLPRQQSRWEAVIASSLG